MFMYMEVTDTFDESNYLLVYRREPKAVNWGKFMIQFRRPCRRRNRVRSRPGWNPSMRWNDPPLPATGDTQP
jgi:hypothetical protein